MNESMLSLPDEIKFTFYNTKLLSFEYIVIWGGILLPYCIQAEGFVKTYILYFQMKSLTLCYLQVVDLPYSDYISRQCVGM